MRWVRQTEVDHPPSEHIVILTEVIKGVLSFVVWKATAKPKDSVPSETTALLEQSQPKENSIIWFVVPALLYTVSNNITLIVLGQLTPAMFNLLMNLKIPITGILAWCFLSERITFRQWLALCLMFIGSALACLKFETEGTHLSFSVIGLILMMIYSSCSASAAVSIDFITRFRFKAENIFLQNVKFCALGLCSNVLVSAGRGNLFDWHHFEWIHMASVGVMALNGLTTALVIKFAGSIVKTYAVSFSAFVSAFFGYIFWHQILMWNFYVGAAICSLAINTYVYDKYRQQRTNE